MAKQTDIADDLVDESGDINAAIAKTAKQQTDERRAPKGFDPACLFLLSVSWVNLFDPVGKTFNFRCKGCGAVVRGNSREKHYNAHKRAAESPLPRQGGVAKTPNRPYPDTDDRQRTADGKTEKETTVAKSNNTPKVSKTKVAREAAIKVLTAAKRQMSMAEIVEGALKDAKVKSADVPAATITAQVNFELAEKSPRITRVTRGVYAIKGSEKNPMPEAAKTETAKPASTKKTAAAKPAAKKTEAAKKSSVQVKPHPKPTSTKKGGRSTAKSAPVNA